MKLGRKPPAVAGSAAAILSVDVRNRAGSDVGEHTRGAVRKMAPARKPAAARPAEYRGAVSSGRIVTLFIGQGHGFIRLASDRDIFFHRSDVCEGTSFNDFAVGDAVTFELFEDPVSGARALRVGRPRPRP